MVAQHSRKLSPFSVSDVIFEQKKKPRTSPGLTQAKEKDPLYKTST
jgi:hypothetical protein